MTLRYDDPRVLVAGNEAFGAFVRALGWAEVHGVDVVPMVAARLFGRERVWARLEAAALVVRVPTGYELHEDAPPPSPSAASTPPSAPRADELGLSPAALRKRRERDRKRDMSRVTDRDMSRPESVTVTPDVTPRERDTSRPAPSLSPSGEKENAEEAPESESGRARDAGVTDRDTSRPVTRDIGAPPGFDAPPPPWAEATAASLAMARGGAIDLSHAWGKFVAHIHERRERGDVAHASEASWRKWVLDDLKFAEQRARRGPPGRAVQRDPPGPKAYAVASHDDPWDDEGAA